jgi:hypothetical protein
MKLLAGLLLAAMLLFQGAVCHARGQATSSFAPRGPEPHATLSNKNGSRKSSHKTIHASKSTAGKHAAHAAVH